MPELVVLGFEGIYRATEVLRDLRDPGRTENRSRGCGRRVSQSAVFVLADAAHPEAVGERLGGYGGGRFFARRCRLRRWNGCSGSESVNELAASARLRSSSSLKCARIFSYVTLPGLWSLRVDAHGRPPR